MKILRYALALILLAVHLSLMGQVRPPRKTVAILIFGGVQIIDYTGPFEVFGQAGYNVFTVGESTMMLETSMKMKVTPSYDFMSAPPADIVVIPGGAVPHDLPADNPMVVWIKQREPAAKYILSVCNGAFALGATGLLSGRQATTTAGMISHMEMYIPGVKPVYDKRFVQDGKFISAGGLTAGMDAAIHIISLMDTPGRAQEVANQMEYNWDPNGKYARTKLVDFQLATLLDFNPPLRGKTLKYEGDERTWTAMYEIFRPQTLDEFAGQLKEMAMVRGWKNELTEGSGEVRKQVWSFKDHNKVIWKLTAEFKKLSEDKMFSAYFNLARN